MNRLFSMALAFILILSTVTAAGCAERTAGLSDTLLSATVSAGAVTSPPDAAETPLTPEMPEMSEIPEESEEPEEFVRVIDPSKPMVALTFDDGPHQTYSDQILDILEANHALATFFELGCHVSEYPDVVAREAAMGCEIGTHSNIHKNLTKLTKNAILDDLAAADAAFIAAGVPAPTMLRPPEGAVNKIVRTVTGRSLITWNIDTEDWRTKDPQKVIDSVQNAGNLDGNVVLMHSIYKSTVEAVETLVPWLQEQGYQLVTVSELMAYYYGEMPEPNKIYGYSYFYGNGRTDAPLALPVPAAENPSDAGNTGETA